ncbi:hypothetical protein [Bosea sp. BK604]|uniref:hypothetical protein n=1 Tax=Bosea sp. BK604 TaxID=2512180 RepID=UPI0010490F36|nr:hypothetical protein [Bosea sp. BK604]TCR64646.1 hypothetical protein EV560_106110 [Bosea sp. BK604]
MRMITIAAAGAALLLATAAGAQAPSGQPSPARPPAAAPQAPATPPAIQSVNVVDITELPESTQSQVNKVVAERGDGELQKLRNAIDSAPSIKSALEAKGLTPTHVVLAQINDSGELTLITKKAG